MPLPGYARGAFDISNLLNNSVGSAQNVMNNGLDSGIQSGGPIGSSSGGSNPLSNIAGLAGSAAGAAFPPAAIAQGALGLIQGITAAVKKKKALDSFPAGEDPELRALTDNLARRKRAFQTGTALNSQNAGIEAMQRQATNAAFNAGGGMAGINRLAQITNQAMMGLQNQSLQGEMAFGQQEAAMVNKLAQTRLEKGMLRYNQNMAEAAQAKTNANRNFMGTLARFLPMQNVDPMYSNSFPNMMNVSGGPVANNSAV